jgi:hypothetical protein
MKPEYHEQGRDARRQGIPLSNNPLANPYKASWTKGWEAEDKSLAELQAQQAENCRLASEGSQRKANYDAAYPSLVEKLSELGIDPYQLRDYLAGLPENY